MLYSPLSSTVLGFENGGADSPEVIRGFLNYACKSLCVYFRSGVAPANSLTALVPPRD